MARRRRIGIVVIPLHHDIATNVDLANRLSVVRHVATFFVDHAQLAGREQFDALARFDHRSRRQVERLMLGPDFADRDERRRFGESVRRA